MRPRGQDYFSHNCVCIQSRLYHSRCQRSNTHQPSLPHSFQPRLMNFKTNLNQTSKYQIKSLEVCIHYTISFLIAQFLSFPTLVTFLSKEIKFNDKPWITKSLQCSIREKCKLYEQYLKNRNINTSHQYKSYRNSLNSLLRIPKQNYYQEYFKVSLGNSKATWKGIKKLFS